MRSISPVILTVVFLTFVGCGKQENKPPKIDLHSAIVMGNLDIIKQHISAGSDINILEPTRSSSPLITAAALGNFDAAKILIESGAALDHQNADGSTALHTATAFGKIEIAQLLIDAGIALNVQNNTGGTALHTAAFFCREEIVQSLLDKGVDKSIKNKMGQTAQQIVEIPFENLIGAYDAVGAGLKPLGLRLDYDRIKMMLPQIADMLQ
ncbi:MAG: ankyrin repeat domain-containing protein [Calditrichaeota bacterium]|nr:MAG: ankyrin repeat domain-containing protein [Calditrichota bacterium]